MPELPVVLAAQPAGASEQLAPVVVSAPLEASVLRALRVRLVVLERLVPLVQVLLGRLVGWARLVLRELPVLGESAVQLAGSVPTEQKVHLARAQPVLRVQRVCLVLRERLVPRRTGRGR